MRLKIYSCHHVEPESVLNTPIYQTFVAGHDLPHCVGLQTDAHGDNIGQLQKFCEMRHQYYVWKNLLGQYDYVGFEHYRRALFLSPLGIEDLQNRYPRTAELKRKVTHLGEELPKAEFFTQVNTSPVQYDEYNVMRANYTEEEQEALKKYVSGYDVLFTLGTFYPVNEQFRRYHPQAMRHWEEFFTRASEILAKRTGRRFVDRSLPWSPYRNMYIMRSDIFAEYMEIVMPVLLDMDEKHPDALPRIWGHMTERFLGAYVLQKAMEGSLFKYKEIPHLLYTVKAPHPGK